MFAGTLSTFRYFRFKAIEFRIQYTSVPMVFGWMGVTCLPKRDLTLDDDELYMLASCDDTVLLDFSTQQDIIMNSPWYSYCSWIDLFSVVIPANGPIDDFQRMRLFWPQHPLRTIQSTSQSSITLQVFARFVEPEVAGPVKQNGLISKIMSGRHEDSYDETSSFTEVFTAQSRNPLNPQNLFAAGAMLMSGYNMFQTITSGSFTNALPGADTLASPQGGEPSNNYEFKNNPIGSLYSSPDKYVLGDGSMLPDPSRQRRNTIREYIEKPTLCAYFLLTNAGTLFELTGVMDPYLRSTIEPAMNEQTKYSRLIYVSQLFRMWRGGVKYTIVFFANAFISARLNIVLVYGDDDVDGTLRSEIIQDVTIRGTTRVDFVVPYLDPLPWKHCYKANYGSFTNFRANIPYIALKYLNLPQSVGDIEPSIPCLVYESAAEDFEFRGVINPGHQLIPDVTETFTAQMKVSELRGGEVMAGGAYKSFYVHTSTQKTFEELAMRWSARDQTNDDAYRHNTPESGTNTPGIFDFMSNFFLFSSGQVKFKLVFFPSDPLPYKQVFVKMQVPGAILDGQFYTNGAVFQQKVEDGLAMIDVSLTRVLEYTVPYVSVAEFESMRGVCELPEYGGETGQRSWSVALLHSDVGSAVTPIPSEVYVSGGKDLSFYCMVPPPFRVQNWPVFYFNPAEDKKDLVY